MQRNREAQRSAHQPNITGFLKRMTSVSWLLLLVLFVTTTNSLLAQQNNAQLVGAVSDPSGALIPGANVSLRNDGTGDIRHVQTDGEGMYTVSLLGAGKYSLTVELAGYKKFEVHDITIATGDHSRVDATLAVGDIAESVSVEASTVGVLQTDSSSVGGLVTSNAVQDLPVNGRNVIRLVQLVPGATEGNQGAISSGTRPDDRRQTSSISANGQNTQANNFLLDGLDNNERIQGTIVVRPSIDALQEVKVDTSTFSAELGRVGGAVVQMVTKSGTNNFHGSAFEFIRNDIFDARNYFNNGKRPKYRQNQFGGSLGGPIWKNKTFFFGDYEGLRIIQGVTITAPVPTPCQLGLAVCNGVQQLGNFSDSSTPIYDPITHQAYPNNRVPLSQISTIAKNYAALFPAAPASTCPSSANCSYTSTPSRTQFSDTGDVRVDHHWRENDNTFARYSLNNVNTLTPGALPIVSVAGVSVVPGGPDTNNFNGTSHQRSQSISLSHTHIFNPNLLLQAGVGILRYVNQNPAANAGQNINDAFGGPVNANTSAQGTDGLALVQLAGYSTLGDSRALPLYYYDTSYVYSATLAWTRGNHSFKFGGAAVRRTFSSFQNLYKASFAFNAAETNSNGGLAGGAGGNAFASMLAGYPHQDLRIVSLKAPQYRTWEPGVFAQDDWHLTKSLTLNLGVRWDLFTPFSEKHNYISNFDATDPNVVAAGKVLVAGQDGVSNTVNIQTSHTNFQPRLGFAAVLRPGLVLRGGFGMTYYPQNLSGNASLKNQPFVSNFTLNQTPGTPTIKFTDPLPPTTPQSTCIGSACGAVATPSLPSFAVAAASVAKFHWATIYMYNLFLEKEFGNNIVTIGYVGEPDRHLGRGFTNFDEPLPPMGSGGCGVTTAIRLPHPCQPLYSALPLVSQITLMKTDGNANYNAFQAVFQRRMRKGLTLSGNYTWAHSLSDVDGNSGICTTCSLIYNNYRYDYANSDFDVRNRIAITGNYEVPWGINSHGLTRIAEKGWSFNGIYAYASGQPFVVQSSSPQINNGAGSDRPNVVAGNSQFKPSLTQWFDVSGFQKQAFGTAGNENRNPFRSPPSRRFDFSIFKNVDLFEGMKLQLRAEFFNLTNTPSFGIPVASFSSYDATSGKPVVANNFGRITSTNVYYTPRDVQFAAKFLF